jgi:hypothetical protein
MRQNTFLKSIVIFSMVSLLLAPALAAEETQKMDPAVGDWLLTSDFNGRSVNSLMMISKDSGGKYQGSWVSFWGINKIDDLKIQDGKITFSITNEFRDQEFTMDFEGTLKDGKLSGTMYSDQWDSDYEGTRIKPFEPIVGVWEFRRQRGDREFVSTLTVSRGDDGQLKVDWEGGPGRRGGEAQNEQENPWEISGVKYEDGKLTFTRKSTNPEREFEMTYALTAKDDTISGTMTTPRGEREMEGKRQNGDLIGKWELTMTSDMGERKQLLWVKPDMTAWFGSTDVGKIKVEDGTISFDYEMSFGDRSFENAFKGKLENGTLTGEMTNSRGTQQVKGKKMAKPQM